MLPAKAAKEQIKALKEKAAHDISAIKVQYQKDKESIKAPDLQAINKQKAEIKDKYAKLIQEKHSSIQKLKDEYNEQVKSTPKVILNAAEKQILKEKTLEIKEAAKKEINELKAKIEQAKEVNRSSDAHLASQKMQMIFQDPISSLNPRMTVKEIVGEGLIIQRQYSDSEIKARVAEALKLVGLSPEYQTRYPHEFSGGQRQRIGIARALIMNPDFIIADEPISALDVSIRAQILNLLTNLKEQLGLTILFIAHDLSVVRFFCDRIAVMYYGKIVEMASAKELFANPMHPYTISLLSAIPQPDPDYEKGRKRIHYNPGQHDYRIDKPSLREIAPGHFVFANDREFEKMQKIYAENNVRSKEAEQ
ncbi:MAG: ATP-binding cassette domain-containing protein [Acholeplasmataceae bacterium]|nr:ATP-binding cassette domain-containing protein [Acholeplasmataceae bacterium]